MWAPAFLHPCQHALKKSAALAPAQRNVELYQLFSTCMAEALGVFSFIWKTHKTFYLAPKSSRRSKEVFVQGCRGPVPGAPLNHLNNHWQEINCIRQTRGVHCPVVSGCMTLQWLELKQLPERDWERCLHAPSFDAFSRDRRSVCSLEWN